MSNELMEAKANELLALFGNDISQVKIKEDSAVIELNNQFFYVNFLGLGSTPRMTRIGFRSKDNKTVILEKLSTLSYDLNTNPAGLLWALDQYDEKSNAFQIKYLETVEEEMQEKLEEMVKDHFTKEYPDVASIPEEAVQLSYATCTEEVIKKLRNKLIENSDYSPTYKPINIRQTVSSCTVIYNYYGNEEGRFKELLQNREFCQVQIRSRYIYLREMELFEQAKATVPEKWGKYYHAIQLLPNSVSTVKFVYDKDKIVSEFNKQIDAELNGSTEHSERIVNRLKTLKKNLAELPSKVVFTVSRDRVRATNEWFSLYDANVDKVLNKSETTFVVNVEQVLFNEDNLLGVTYRGKDIRFGEKI